MMFLRFLGCMAMGMFGVGLVLKTLLDRVFLDWDIFGEMKEYLSERSRQSSYFQTYEYEDDFSRRLSQSISMRDAASEASRGEAPRGVSRY